MGPVKSLPISRTRIGEVFASVVTSHQPIRLTSHTSSAILVDEEQWRAIEATLYRLSAPSLGGARVPAGRGEQTRTEGAPHVRS
jgi:PHD/YefM family antitoxin component YafN of YafNO toxin-antitoxin module